MGEGQDEMTSHPYYDRDPLAGTEQRDANAGDPEERVERLTAEIGETRDGLTQTINEIGERLEPSNLAREAGETVRANTLGKVEQMTYGAQETWRDVTSGNPGSIVDSIKANPVPAGMVGLGLAMLFMNRGKASQQRFRSQYGGGLPGDHGYVRDAAWEPREWQRRTGDNGSNPLAAVGNAVSGAAGSAGETVGQVAGQVGRTAGDVGDTIGQAAGQLPQQAGQLVEQGSGQVRRFIDDNPLGAGVIAMAAGAALGLLLPSTQLERDTMGQARDQVVGQAETAVNEALDKVDAQPTA